VSEAQEPRRADAVSVVVGETEPRGIIAALGAENQALPTGQDPRLPARSIGNIAVEPHNNALKSRRRTTNNSKNKQLRSKT
jgi:hypothetical protein